MRRRRKGKERGEENENEKSRGRGGGWWWRWRKSEKDVGGGGGGEKEKVKKPNSSPGVIATAPQTARSTRLCAPRSHFIKFIKSLFPLAFPFRSYSEHTHTHLELVLFPTCRYRYTRLYLCMYWVLLCPQTRKSSPFPSINCCVGT